MGALGQLGLFLVLLLLGYFAGTRAERLHLESLRAREAELASQPCTTLSTVPSGWEVQRAQLVQGSVVVSLDYFKRFLAALRSIFGGRIRAYEPLLDRGRREALLRMREQARAGGFGAVINVRLESSRLATGGSAGRGTTGVEVLAFGTALEIGSSGDSDRSGA